MYSYIVADDEYHVRKGIISLVTEIDPEFALVGEAVTGQEAAELVRRHRPDLVFMDVRMPGGSGLTAIRNTIDTAAGTMFVIVSSYSQFEYARQAVQLGALDYLVKPVSIDEMQTLLQRVHASIDSSLKVAQRQVTPESAREPEVDTAAVAMRLMGKQYARGIGISQFAEQVGVTPNYLTTCFHDRYGEAPLAYLTRLRMQAAKELLRSGMRVQDVSLRVGYRDSRHFSRKFSDFFGVSPSDFRSLP